jgi:hypothetical protein
MNDETKYIIDTLHPDGTDIEKFQLSVLFNIVGKEDLFALWEFEKHLNEQRIEQKDIQKYKSFDEIRGAVDMAELKLREKEYRKQIQVIYDTSEWFILKPLSYESSLAYGATTKWCTASKQHDSYFYDYCTRGSLVYVINRKTADKFAMYVEINPHKFKKGLDISFWNAEDKKTDSMELDIPDEIMSVLRQQINDKTKLKPNKYFFNKDELDKMQPDDEKAAMVAEPDEAPMAPQIYRAIEQLEDGEDYGEIINEEDGDDIQIEEVAGVEVIEGFNDEADEEMTDEQEREVIVEVMGQQRRMREIEEDVFVEIDENNQPLDVPQEVLNRARARMNQIIAENELRLNLTNDAMMEVAGEMQDLGMMIKEKDHSLPIKQARYELAQGILPLDIERPFTPAPWLNKAEIEMVNEELSVAYIYDADEDHNRYAYPNGRVIHVTDTIRNNTIVRRSIAEVRPGRNEFEPFNPFGVNSKSKRKISNINRARYAVPDMPVNEPVEEGDYEVEEMLEEAPVRLARPRGILQPAPAPERPAVENIGGYAEARPNY